MPETAPVNSWLIEPPERAVSQAIARISRAADVVRVAVMPDVHLAAGVSNGTVVATNHLIYPSAVGADIGCGFAAVAFHGKARSLTRRAAAEAVLQDLPAAVPVMRHRRRDGLPELDFTATIELSCAELLVKALKDGREELGTLGRGNHFLEFQEDDEGRLWVMVHSGSRAMGQHITAFHLRRAQPANAGLSWLDAESDDGRAYLNDVAWALEYAAAGRNMMLRAAAALVGNLLGLEPDESTWINTDHNHVQKEMHDGQWVWVHRKGANVAEPGLPNMIPGSMATCTLHVEGRGEAESLNSSSHGAGRKLSRSAAHAKIRRKDLQRQLDGIWIDPRVAGKLTDESPAAYKDIDAVMRAQRPLVRIVRKLRPVLCYKGN